MKFSRAISRVKGLTDEKTNVSKTISVLVLRVLKLNRGHPRVFYLVQQKSTEDSTFQNNKIQQMISKDNFSKPEDSTLENKKIQQKTSKDTLVQQKSALRFHFTKLTLIFATISVLVS
jgi:uncharacterized membrane protein